MTLNGVGLIAFILRFFTAFDSFAQLLKGDLYNIRKILSSVPVFYFWPKLTHLATRSAVSLRRLRELSYLLEIVWVLGGEAVAGR